MMMWNSMLIEFKQCICIMKLVLKNYIVQWDALLCASYKS